MNFLILHVPISEFASCFCSPSFCSDRELHLYLTEYMMLAFQISLELASPFPNPQLRLSPFQMIFCGRFFGDLCLLADSSLPMELLSEDTLIRIHPSSPYAAHMHPPQSPGQGPPQGPPGALSPGAPGPTDPMAVNQMNEMYSELYLRIHDTPIWSTF